ncbi:MAG: FixH family protein [Bacteroidota bacterium]
MKLNWGWSIAIFYTFFVVVMVSMVVRASQHKPNLVVENYYEEDLRYQSHYNKVQNQQALLDELSIQYTAEEEELALTFPQDHTSASGIIHFFRPSNKYEDVKIAIRLDESGQMHIPVTKLKRGLWRIKVDWEANGAQYFKEESIVR